MIHQIYDVIIVGGGVMGCSTAYHLLKQDPGIKLIIVEKDPTYLYASTTLSMANVRLQFSLKENIQISQYAMDFLSNFSDEMAVDDERPDVQFHQEGNLFLWNEPGLTAAREDFDLQRALGCPVEWWDPSQVKKAYPLYTPDKYSAATFGPRDGYIDAYSLLMGLRAKARQLGAGYRPDEVTAIEVEAGRAAGARLASGEKLSAAVVVNCAGAWAGDVAKTAGVYLPLAPTKRQVFALDPAVKPDRPLPLTILPSGLYFRTETGGLILLGKSLPEDPVGYDFTWDRDRFMELLWPELAEFVPAFDTLKLKRGWAGLYAVNTLDHNAILGEWPELKGFYLANGFSGHGLQQGPAVGRYLAELILGRKPVLDLRILGPERILEKRPLSEKGIV
ncbi:MAG: FAD-binding oxidoreductase [Thermodesulfobacteriota bacterium]